MVEKEPEASAPSSITGESCERAKASFKVQCHTVRTPISTYPQHKELRARQLKASMVCAAATRVSPDGEEPGPPSPGAHPSALPPSPTPKPSYFRYIARGFLL